LNMFLWNVFDGILKKAIMMTYSSPYRLSHWQE
jgi:hypothetical protein